MWRSLTPTICQVHGHAIAGGCDIALCCDLAVMADDARIGYPPARVWGCPSTAMWVYRLGAEKAKRMLLTGDTIDGATAAAWGLVGESVPAAELADRAEQLAERLASVPINQLAMQKLMINQAYDNMGLHGTQILATLFDGITRHSPEGRWFKDFAEQHGFHAAVAWRDSGRPILDGGGPLPGPTPSTRAEEPHKRRSSRIAATRSPNSLRIRRAPAPRRRPRRRRGAVRSPGPRHHRAFTPACRRRRAQANFLTILR